MECVPVDADKQREIRHVLSEKFKDGLKKREKTIDSNVLDNVITVFEPLYDDIKWVQGWMQFGFNTLYVHSAGDKATWVQFAELCVLDDQIGWYEETELWWRIVFSHSPR